MLNKARVRVQILQFINQFEMFQVDNFLWFHNNFRKNGSIRKAEEVDAIKKHTQKK